jgi:glutathione S-transferase
MKLYIGKTLMTNPRRVTIYLAEKGLSMETVALDMRGGEGRSPAFLQKSPAGTVPVLELDDGTFLPESAAIVEYLEERFPTPTMLGETPQERAQVRATERMATDFAGRNGLMMAHTHPFLPKVRPGFVQYPDVAKALEGARDFLLQALEARIGDREFLAGDVPTVADCTFFAQVDTTYALFDYRLPPHYPRLLAWYGRFSRRPSAQRS